MRDRLIHTVKDFLKDRLGEGPLLVGFSGGPDSLALLHLLLECRTYFNIDLQAAHVDHGWRAESAEEAQQLRRHAESLNLPFYFRRLQDVLPKEDAAREARLTFFQELYQRLGCQALVLGHQADDQAETVLKRILEGASLPMLGGIRPETVVNGMTIWRPLLDVDKAVLKAWLAEKGLTPLEDRTNHDAKYLRARMRTSILPELELHFKKEVAGNLRRLGESARELEEYLARQVRKYEGLIIEDKEEYRVDLADFYPLEPVEIKIFLKKFGEKNKIFLSHSALQNLYDILTRETLHRKVGSGSRWIEVRGRCIAIKKN